MSAVSEVRVTGSGSRNCRTRFCAQERHLNALDTHRVSGRSSCEGKGHASSMENVDMEILHDS